MNFKGQVAIVTGAGSARGFGHEICNMMAERGASLVLADFNEDGVLANAKELQEKHVDAIGVKVDVSDPESVENMVKTALEHFGRIDILVNNAGISQKVTSLDMTLADWNRIMSVDLTGIFLCCHSVLPIMVKQHYGRIVNVSSISGRNGGGITGGAHYCAAKAGVIGYSKALGKEFALQGITVNCVAPGASKTDINGKRFEDKSIPDGVPMQRRGEREEIAAAVLFLACPLASFITGCTIDANGGAYMA